MWLLHSLGQQSLYVALDQLVVSIPTPLKMDHLQKMTLTLTKQKQYCFTIKSRMGNPETKVTLGTQDTEQRPQHRVLKTENNMDPRQQTRFSQRCFLISFYQSCQVKHFIIQSIFSPKQILKHCNCGKCVSETYYLSE
jgi:hypothetical protein